jgi:DNA polymerase-3 subunit delta
VKLAPERLEAQLAGGLSPIYLITGDDPLLTGEALDRVRARAREAGHTERSVFEADRYFDWAELAAAAGAMSLFAERQLIELRLPTGKPGAAGAKALEAYAADPPPDALLLIAAGRMDKRALGSGWARAIDGAGVIVQVWPVDRARLPNWIGQRLEAQGLQPRGGVTRLIAERVEGNLLAADQEIRKLALLLEPGPIDEDDVLRAVADSARYDVFQLVDAASAGDLGRAQRILDGLSAEGTAPTLILWAFVRELRAVNLVAWQTAGGGSPDAAMRAAGIWPRRQPVVRKALARHSRTSLDDLLLEASRVERIVKGAARGSPLQALTALIARYAGVGRRARGEAAA